MLSQKLKEQTKINHQQLEKKLIPTIRDVKTMSEYAVLLRLFYSYFGALELKINQYIGSADLPDIKSRRKTALLIEDLVNINAAIPEIVAEKDLPKIENGFHALGALYVIEGSTLGGKIITRLLMQQMKMNASSSIAFFNGYGEETDIMWKSFQQHLDQPGKIINEEEIIAAANDTFRCFSNWYDKVYLSFPVERDAKN